MDKGTVYLCRYLFESRLITFLIIWKSWLLQRKMRSQNIEKKWSNSRKYTNNMWTHSTKRSIINSN